MLRRVRRSELNELAAEWSFEFDDSELDEFHTLTNYVADLLDQVDERPAPAPQVAKARREVGTAPEPDQDPCNAIVRWCNVSAEVDGPLTGVRVGMKDCIAIAGVPMTCGSRLMRNFVPTRDAVVTRRLLDAGAEIVAVVNMDHFAFSGGGDSSSYGATLNPHDLTRTTGGSSSGSAAALYYDGIDVTLGGDQGGSIRAPASWTGVIGLKPTHSLVPYTGIVGLDQGMDHCGPMGRTVTDVARLLETIAGEHPSDPRQRGGTPTQPYVDLVANAPESLEGVTFGIVEEGLYDADGNEHASVAAMREAVERLESLGAEVRTVSIPEHLRAGSLCFVGLIEGITALLSSGGNGYHHSGEYWPELSDAVGQGMRTFGPELSHQIKLVVTFGTYLRRTYFGGLYAKGANLRASAREDYDRALSEADYLLMPTTPWAAHEHLPELSISEHVMRGWGMVGNTAPTDVTGHPAISLPTGELDGLPIGTMLVGRHFDDGGLLRVARAYEREYGWRPSEAPALPGSEASGAGRFAPAGQR